jgi:hypothetical protein
MGIMEENHEIKYITSKNNVSQIHDAKLREKPCSLRQHYSRDCTGLPPIHTLSLYSRSTSSLIPVKKVTQTYQIFTRLAKIDPLLLSSMPHSM